MPEVKNAWNQWERVLEILCPFAPESPSKSFLVAVNVFVCLWIGTQLGRPDGPVPDSSKSRQIVSGHFPWQFWGLGYLWTFLWAAWLCAVGMFAGMLVCLLCRTTQQKQIDQHQESTNPLYRVSLYVIVIQRSRINWRCTLPPRTFPGWFQHCSSVVVQS